MSSLCAVVVATNKEPDAGACLRSIGPFVVHWVLCHTDAAELAVAEVERHLKGVAGGSHRISHADAGACWTEALRLARGKADYHLLLGPSMRVEGTERLRELTADSYLVRETGELECWTERIVSDRHVWRGMGSARPFLQSATARTRARLPGLQIIPGKNPSLQETQSEINLLKRDVERGVNVARSTFHLAECYKELGNLLMAIEHYESRSAMAGWDEETWYSLYMIARLQESLGISRVLVQDQYLRAYQLRATRIEPLFHLARYCRNNDQYHLAYMFAGAGLGSKIPEDLLLINRPVYEYGLALEYALACSKLGKHQQAARAAEKILSHESLPESARNTAERCLQAPSSRGNSFTNTGLSAVGLRNAPDAGTDGGDTQQIPALSNAN